MALTNLQSFLLLLLLVSAIYFIDRKNFKRQGIVFLRRTSHFLHWIEKKADMHKKFFTKLGDFSIVLSLGAIGAWYLYSEKMSRLKWINTLSLAIVFFWIGYVSMPLYAALAFAIFGATGMIMYFLIGGTYGILTGAIKQASLQLVLPVDIPGAPILFVPIHYWIIGIFSLVVLHEFSHALVARAQGIKVKSLGYGFLAIIPLAFAEPDEKQMKKASSLTKSRVYCAGAAVNIMTALLLLGLMHALFVPGGVRYTGTIDGYPADGVLPENGIITAVDSKEFKEFSEFYQLAQAKKPGDTIGLIINGQAYSLQLAKNPKNESLPFLGINTPPRDRQHFEVNGGIKAVVGTTVASGITGLYSLLFWLYFLWLGIGLANLLPMKPIDGGLMMEELFKKLNMKPYWISHLSVVVIVLIVFNLVGPKLISFIT